MFLADVKTLAPFEPSDAHPFDAKKAAHLFRRAGFGARPDEIAHAVEIGLEATVDELVDDDPEELGRFQALWEQVAGSLIDADDIRANQAFWLHRMVHSRRPLREKLTLFWHGHFATSVNKVGDMSLMRQQLDTLRSGALGNFGDLVLAVAKDPAMIVWLDGETSTQEHPNENFARELMELFTCGIGNYTERDVLEAARAFTGWHREGSRFVFHAESHDDGRKQFLGRSGRFDGGEIIQILLQHRATPRYLAGKLLRFFAGEPTPELLDAAAEQLTRNQLSARWFLRDLFLSNYFYSPECLRRRIASPVEYVVGTTRTLAMRVPATELADHVAAMGQELFAPPSVKGWDGEQKWIHSGSWPARLSFANTVIQYNSDMPQSRHLPLEQHLPPEVTDPGEAIDRLGGLLLTGELPEQARSALVGLLVQSDDGNGAAQYREDPNFRNERNRAAVSAILSLPEYHAI